MGESPGGLVYPFFLFLKKVAESIISKYTHQGAESGGDKDGFICGISEVYNLPEGQKMAGGERGRIYRASYQRRSPHSSGLKRMAQKERPAAEAVF